MIVVSDTSPVCYLVLIDEVGLLSSLFGEIHIPTAVQLELADKRAPQNVRRWIARPPSWLSIHDVPTSSDPALDRLHPGESEAILLAERRDADLVLLDDKAARQTAQSRGLKVTGLLGALVEASDRGLVDLVEAVEKLQKTSFRAGPKLLRSVLEGR